MDFLECGSTLTKKPNTQSITVHVTKQIRLNTEKNANEGYNGTTANDVFEYVFKLKIDYDPINQPDKFWNHCGLVTPYGNRDLGQHWLR